MKFHGEIRYKDSLKHRGHDLIEELARMGTHKITTYGWLARELGWSKERTHFSAVHTTSELELMVDTLQRFYEKVCARRQRKPWRKIERYVKPAPVPKPPPSVETIMESLRKEERQKTTYRNKRKDTLPRSEYLKAMEELKEAQMYRSHEWEGAARIHSFARPVSMLDSILKLRPFSCFGRMGEGFFLGDTRR